MKKVLNIIIHILALGMFVQLLFGVYWVFSSYFPVDVNVIMAQCHDKACSDNDAISIGYQLGRLDFVSVALTMLGVVIATLGLMGFWQVKRSCEDTARRTMDEFRKEIAPKLLKEYVETMFSDLMSEASEAKRERSNVENSEADWGDHLDDNNTNSKT